MGCPVLGTSSAAVPSWFTIEMPSALAPETKASTGVPEEDGLGDDPAVVLEPGEASDVGVGVGLAAVLLPLPRMKRK